MKSFNRQTGIQNIRNQNLVRNTFLKIYKFLTNYTHDWFFCYTESHSIRLKFEQFSFLKPKWEADIHSKNYSVYTDSHRVKKTVFFTLWHSAPQAFAKLVYVFSSV